VTAPTIKLAGVIHDMPELAYHASPGLSSTGMKYLLRSPLHYRRNMDHRPIKAAFDLGHCVHAKVLGTGLDIVTIPADLLASNGAASTKDAKAWIEKARAAGQVPVKADVVAQVNAIAEAVLANPKAAALMSFPGAAEVSLFADDPDSGVHMRGRIDRLDTLPDGRLVDVDLKTTTDVRRNKIVRTIEDFGYDLQSEVYRHLLRLTTGAEIAPTHLIFVEVEQPHEVRVVTLAHPDWVEVGTHKMRQAIDIYKRCMASNTWPGDDDAPGSAEPIEPRPYYLENMIDNEMEAS